MSEVAELSEHVLMKMRNRKWWTLAWGRRELRKMTEETQFLKGPYLLE